MMRRLFELFAILSLCLTLVVLVWWRWSYRAGASLAYQGGQWNGTVCNSDWCVVSSGAGGVGVSAGHHLDDYGDARIAAWHRRNETNLQRWTLRDRRASYPAGFGCRGLRQLGLGFAWGVADNEPTYSERVVVVPIWSLALLTFLPYTWIVGRWRKQRRRVRLARQGLCSDFGYDLRASQGRCPECGSAFAGAA
jgi:hypothetical protein